MAVLDLDCIPVSVQLPLSSMSVSGVYLLRRGRKIVYVGQSCNIARRLGQHLSEGRKRFDSFTMLPCAVKRALVLEKGIIEAFLPEHNTCTVASGIRFAFGSDAPISGDRVSVDTGISEAEAAFVLGMGRSTFRECFQKHSTIMRRQGRNRSIRPGYRMSDIARFWHMPFGAEAA